MRMAWLPWKSVFEMLAFYLGTKFKSHYLDLCESFLKADFILFENLTIFF